MTAAVRSLRSWHVLAVAVLLLSAAGCVRVHIPKPSRGGGIAIHDLSEHVDFLTQPALKGRKCRSIESVYVRQYLRQQFETAGLVPWARTSSFDQSFGFGTNVIGVLKGSDPTLADQVVLVCAHYDGLGVQNGKVLPGAADDAAGVAVMLQVAERLAARPQGLRRSVAFAALDGGQESYFGAFAFTLRKDFDPFTLTAVVNLDLLGRPNFDVIGDTLIVVGTEGYPEIREVLRKAAERAAGPAATGSTTSTQATTRSAAGMPLRVFQGGSDLLPPIADYFAFQQWQLPVLLLTNGLYSDYHKPTDSADKLHYDLLRRDANVAVYLVRDLASCRQPPSYAAPAAGDRDELRGIRITLEEVLAHADGLSLTPLERQRLDQLTRRAAQLLAMPDYTLADRKAFIIELAEKGAPSIIRFFYPPPKPDPAKLFSFRQLIAALSWYEFFASHRSLASYGTQQVFRHFLDARGNLLRLLWPYTFAACEIHRDEISYTGYGDGRYRLSFIFPRLKIQAGISTREFDVQYAADDMRGTPGEIVDTCLLDWAAGEEDYMAKVMPVVLSVVTGRKEGVSYRDWLTWRCREVDAADGAVWERDLWQSRNPDLLRALLEKAASDGGVGVPEDALRRIISDRRMRADVRASAITALPSPAGKDALLAMVDLLGDATFVPRRRNMPAFDPTFPFYGHVGMREARLKSAGQAATTLGIAAHDRLKTLSGQDFRGDAKAWREWALMGNSRLR